MKITPECWRSRREFLLSRERRKEIRELWKCVRKSMRDGGTWIRFKLSYQASLEPIAKRLAQRGFDVKVIDNKQTSGWDNLPIWTMAWKCAADVEGEITGLPISTSEPDATIEWTGSFKTPEPSTPVETKDNDVETR